MKMLMRMAALLALALLVVWCVFPGRLLFKRWRLEKNYKSAGYTMQPGCNGAWANQAMFKLYSLSNELEQVQQSPIPDTNELLRIQREITIAQKELAFRDEDCRQRGHAGTIPVKLRTNTPSPEAP